MVKLAVLNDVDDAFLLVSCYVPVFFKTRVTKSLSSCRDPSHLTLTLCSPFEFLSFILTFRSDALSNWLSNKTQIFKAGTPPGTGIDKPDVRFVYMGWCP